MSEDPVKDGLNWYVYGNNNPLVYTDPNGLDAVLVNFKNWAEGYGHFGVLVQNSDGNWVSGDFGGAPNTDHIKGSLDGSDTGRFWSFDTETSDVNEAISYVANKLADGDNKADYIVFNTDTEMDTKMLSKINEYNETYKTKDSSDEPYRLVGNSCLDASYNILDEGGIFIPHHLVAPNLTFTAILSDFKLDLSLFFLNIGRAFEGKEAVSYEVDDNY